jgi:signal transduction histidine kinase
LGNALVYGDQNTPVVVEAGSENGQFKLSVKNGGPAIPEDVQEKLFLPFARGNVKKGQKGLGLGLYIAAEIARAHEGRIEVISTGEETRFTLIIPVTNSEFVSSVRNDKENAV